MKSNFAAAAMAALLAISLCVLRTAPAQAPSAKTPNAAYPTIDLKKDCGAKGDGATNDTAAFQKAAEQIQAAGGGTLAIPKAVYVVGRQEHVEDKTPYYQSQGVFAVSKVNFLLIEGNGATLRFAPGLRYGSFDPKSGEVYSPPLLACPAVFFRKDLLCIAGQASSGTHFQNTFSGRRGLHKCRRWRMRRSARAPPSPR